MAAVALLAHDLLTWTRVLAPDAELARAEPKRLRYRLLYAAGMMARSARRITLRLAAGWPWADELVAAFNRVRHLNIRI